MKTKKNPVHAEPAALPLVEYVTADALDLSDGPVILYHGCNNIGAWGGGFTAPLTKKYQAAFDAYREWSQPRNAGAAGNHPFGLGLIQLVDVETGAFQPKFLPMTDNPRPIRMVCNAITQDGVGFGDGQKPPVRYRAIRASLNDCAYYAKCLGAHIRMPWVGCGLAGGDRSAVQTIIESVAAETGVRIVVCDLPKPAPPWTDLSEGE